MLTTAEIAAILERTTYMPGWSFTAYDGRWEGQHLVITALLPDAYQPGATLALDVHSMLPPMRDEAQLHSWIMWRLARLAVHEVREWYRVDGKVYDDPHGPNADRDNPEWVSEGFRRSHEAES